jgi:hypothetical protein
MRFKNYIQCQCLRITNDSFVDRSVGGAALRREWIGYVFLTSELPDVISVRFAEREEVTPEIEAEQAWLPVWTKTANRNTCALVRNRSRWLVTSVSKVQQYFCGRGHRSIVATRTKRPFSMVNWWWRRVRPYSTWNEFWTGGPVGPLLHTSYLIDQQTWVCPEIRIHLDGEATQKLHSTSHLMRNKLLEDRPYFHL